MGTTNKYKTHFLMQAKDIKTYVIDVLDYFDNPQNIEVRELSDGNINYVFQVKDIQTNKSLVIKQADKFLRSSGRPLDVYRNKIEAEILKLQGVLAPEFVPKVYAYDEVMCVLAMEDISDYQNLRKELMKQVQFDHLADNITTFMTKTLLPTTDLIMARDLKKANVKMYTNIELCDISEDLVLTEPYNDYKGRNIVLPENLAFVTNNLYQNTKLHAHIAYLRNNYMNNAQALLHGDLHSGSIFINEKGIKVIDPEFAFYGPIGYDIGNVIANLLMTRAHHLFCGTTTAFIDWINDTVTSIYDDMTFKLNQVYQQEVKLSLYQTDDFKNDYLNLIMSDALGYTGTEIIRRVVGDTKVEEITSVKDIDIRVNMERMLINIGIHLIINRETIKSGSQLIQEIEKIS